MFMTQKEKKEKQVIYSDTTSRFQTRMLWADSGEFQGQAESTDTDTGSDLHANFL